MSSEGRTSGTRVRRAWWRTAAEGASWFLFGFAVGVLGFFAVSNAVTGWDQSRMKASAPIAFSTPEVAKAVSGPPGNRLDFTGYEAQDLAYWSRVAAGAPFARLVISRMELDVIAVKGADVPDLWRGPGWIRQTDLPGPTGNVGMSGHRTTFGHPFGRLDLLGPGDTIDLYSPYRRYRYVVESTQSVTPEHTEVVAHTVDPQLTLTTCDPPYSAKYRLIVHAKLVDARLLETGTTP
jgi:LPXTG-site transpeptidase (sortase) family protein